MLCDPAQVRSLAADRRFKPVRKWLFNALVSLATCAGAGCRADLPPEPLPLPKRKPKTGKPVKSRRARLAFRADERVKDCDAFAVGDRDVARVGLSPADPKQVAVIAEDPSDIG